MQRPIARKGGINMYNDQIVGVRFFISISNNDLDERVYYYKASALETFKKGIKCSFQFIVTMNMLTSIS